jgi:16S rRNA (cytosine1402-N4)-methyltransferase
LINHVPHLPVMLEEVIEVLNPKIGGIYVDATTGVGGHSEHILELIGPQGKLIGIDKDSESLRVSEQRLSGKGIVLKRGNFSEMENLLSQEGIHQVHGILFDLGVSMLQLKNFERGFSFLSQERLDMRMDKGQDLSAWEIVNTYPEKRLEEILREYGEERRSKSIVKAIVRRRKTSPIDTCSELAKLIGQIYVRRGRTHPATKTFQALRIEVNKELEQLREGLDASVQLLKTGGRFCVISYHSLEDRIVKRFIADHARRGILRVITKKPRTPSAQELRNNPSSRSAKLRAAEKL